MIKFNELRIDPDKNTLIIDAEVPEEYQDTVAIEYLYIDTQDTAKPYEPSNKCVYKKDYSTTKPTSIHLEIPDENEWMQSMTVESQLNAQKFTKETVKNNLLFVWIRVSGDPGVASVCGRDNSLTLGIVANPVILCSKGLGHIKEVEEKCMIPKGFIDFLLLYKAFELACRTNDVVSVLRYWNLLQRNITEVNYAKPKRGGCSCGR